MRDIKREGRYIERVERRKESDSEITRKFCFSDGQRESKNCI